MRSNCRKVFALFVSSAVVCALSYSASKQPFSELVNYRFQIEHFSKNVPDLYVACYFWNHSDDPHHLRDPVVIRGIQREDGNFFPSVKLAVSSTENGPWTPVDPKMPDGKKMELVVPVTIRVAPVFVDCAPLLPQVDKMKWAKVELSTGDAIIVELKEVGDAGKPL